MLSDKNMGDGMPVELRAVETVYEGYSRILRATLVDADGGAFTREIEDHGRAATVLPYDPDRKTALLVSLPRAPVIWSGGPPELIETPAGMLDGESPQDAVRREALEEAGVRLTELEHLGAPYSSAGVSSERIDLYLAPYSVADRVGDGGGLQEERENITVLEIPLSELWAMVEAGRVEDLKTLALVFALRVRWPELFAG
jgi:nudix-type nucleoside diphosphatase (YffH/AdpP family)